jgi:prevent-host-death family protein
LNRKLKLRIVPATQAKNNFGEVIELVNQNDEVQIIERDGLPVTGIVSMSDVERPYPEKVSDLPQVATSAKHQRAAGRLRAILSEMRKGGEKFSEEEVEAKVQRGGPRELFRTVDPHDQRIRCSFGRANSRPVFGDNANSV